MTPSRRSFRIFPILVGVLVGCVAQMAGPAWAGGRPEGSAQNWFGSVSGGYAFAQGDSSDVVDDSWTISGGATFWPSEWPAGLNFELGYSDFDLSSRAIRTINDAIALDPADSGRIDDGYVRNWQLTVNAIWGPGDHDNGLYLIGGIGAYRLEGAVTQDALVYYPPTCDPWYWWWCYPGGVGTGSIVKAKDTTTEFGWNVGLGYSFASADGQLFVELSYHDIDTRNSDLTFMPLTFGYRW
jgi:opacity protein-like surface antigen